MSNYDQLHRQCRTLENLFDTKLTSYSQLIHTLSRPGADIEASGSAARWKDLELELDDIASKVRLFLTLAERFCADTQALLISQLEEIIDQLEKLATSPDLMSPSMLRAIQRHGELYQDDMRELKRAKVPRAFYLNPFSTDGVIFTSRQTSNKRWIKRPCFQEYGMTLSTRVSLFQSSSLTHYSQCLQILCRGFTAG